MKKHKRLFVLFMCLLVLSLSSCIHNFNTNKEVQLTYDDQIIIKFSDDLSKNHPFASGDYEFKRLVEEKSEGRIIVEIYPDSSLGDEKTATNKLIDGQIQMQRVNTSSLVNHYEDYKVLSLPYLYKNADHMFRVLDSEIGEEFLNPPTDLNFVGLAWLDTGGRNFYNSKRAISAPSDIEGLTIRVQNTPVMIDLVNILGATAVPMSSGEVYLALKNNEIDGAENSILTYEYTNHYKTAPYLTLDAHTREPELFIINKNFLNSLSPEDREIITQSAKEASLYQRKILKTQKTDSGKFLTDEGVIITSLTDEEKKVFSEKVTPLYEKYAYDRMDLINKIKSIE